MHIHTYGVLSDFIKHSRHLTVPLFAEHIDEPMSENTQQHLQTINKRSSLQIFICLNVCV